MRYHIQSTLGTGPSGDVMLGVGDWLGAPPVAIRYITINDHETQNLRVQSERLAMIGHPNLGLIEDISASGSDDVLIATTLAEGTLAAVDPADLAVEHLLAMVADVAAGLDALHERGLHHGHVSSTNIMFRGGVTFLGDTGLKTFRTHGPRNSGQDRRRQDVTELVRLVGSLTAATEGATGPGRAQSVLAACQSMTAAAGDYTSPRHHLAAFTQGLAEISVRPEIATPPLSPRVRVLDVPRRPQSSPPTPNAPSTPPRIDGTRPRGIPKPLVASAAVLLVVAGAMAGIRWTSGAGERAENESVDTPLEEGNGDVNGSLATVLLDLCPNGRALDPGITRDARAVEGDVDLDGDGCAEQITWTTLRAELTVRLSSAGGEVNRFRLGEPGDEFLVGDWDCNGQATPGLYRPATGETYLFDRWASAERPATATPGPVLDDESAATASAPENGCDRITTPADPGW